MQPLPPSAPGTLTFIGGIKTALVNDHHEAFYWWWKSKLRDATLFHVDGHDDMKEAYVEHKLETEQDYGLLNIGNFICPAVYHGVISSVYWLNPHSVEERRLKYIERPLVHFMKNGFGRSAYLWYDPKERKEVSWPTGEFVSHQGNIHATLPLVLDIDLDAFCCHRNETLSHLPHKRKDYEGAISFEKRIDETVKTLSKIPKPDLITIASSQGDGKNRCYVPPFMVEEVSRYLAIYLRKLYE